MPTLTTDREMNDFLNIQDTARAEARTLANISRRAATLFTDGYTAYQSPTCPRLWTVTSPEAKTYCVRAASLVPGDEFLGDSCSCPCYAKHKTCKHIQAIVLAQETACEEAQIAAWEQRMEWENYCNGRFDR